MKRDYAFERYLLELKISENENATIGNMNDENWTILAITGISELAKSARKMLNALEVLTSTPHIQEYLKVNDPKALNQALESILKEPIEMS